MVLRDLIDELKARPADRAVPVGFGNPHSYRGYYEDLAFEPVNETTVGAMLAAAEGAMGQTYQGYKGGYYTMRECTDCWLAEEGSTGEGIGPVLIGYMCGPRIPEPKPMRPMTAADRDPQEGDVLLSRDALWSVFSIERFATGDACLRMGRDGMTLSCDRSTWGAFQYVSRDDDGPVMVEEE